MGKGLFTLVLMAGACLPPPAFAAEGDCAPVDLRAELGAPRDQGNTG